jgi:endonuclease YncB( thermonuclease family)
VAPDAGGPPRKLRLDGIDAPEICQPGGEAARQALTRRALSRRVEVRVRRQDDYGRELARVQVDHQDLGAQMVREGQAWSYRWRHHAGPYAAEEAAARQARRGVFAAEQPESPRDFRKRHGPCQAPDR